MYNEKVIKQSLSFSIFYLYLYNQSLPNNICPFHPWMIFIAFHLHFMDTVTKVASNGTKFEEKCSQNKRSEESSKKKVQEKIVTHLSSSE